MAHIIAISNQKGGVGKTTTAVALAVSLAENKKRVLLIDSDPQSSASSGLNIDKKEGFYDFLSTSDKNLMRFIQSTKWFDLHVLPADPRLSGLELEWASVERPGFVLKEKLQQLPYDFDYILVDCPPSLGLLTVNALVAARYLLVPLQCEYYALEGLSLLLNSACSIKENLNSHLSLIGILLTMFDSRNSLSHKVEEQVRKHFDDRVFSTKIPRNVRLSEAPSHGLPISVYDPRSTGALAYTTLALELMSKIKKLELSKANELSDAIY